MFIRLLLKLPPADSQAGSIPSLQIQLPVCYWFVCGKQLFAWFSYVIRLPLRRCCAAVLHKLICAAACASIQCIWQHILRSTPLSGKWQHTDQRRCLSISRSFVRWNRQIGLDQTAHPSDRYLYSTPCSWTLREPMPQQLSPQIRHLLAAQLLRLSISRKPLDFHGKRAEIETACRSLVSIPMFEWCTWCPTAAQDRRNKECSPGASRPAIQLPV